MTENQAARFRPVTDRLSPRGCARLADLVPKPIQVRHEPIEMLEHIQTIVDEMCGSDVCAMVPLLVSLAAEPNAVWSQPSALVERLALQPPAGQLCPGARSGLGVVDRS